MANQIAKANSDIRKTIESIELNTAAVVDSIQKFSQGVTELSSTTTRVASAVEEL